MFGHETLEIGLRFSFLSRHKEKVLGFIKFCLSKAFQSVCHDIYIKDSMLWVDYIVGRLGIAAEPCLNFQRLSIFFIHLTL